MSDLEEQKKEVETPVKKRKKTVSARVTDETYFKLREIADQNHNTIDNVLNIMICFALKKLSEN